MNFSRLSCEGDKVKHYFFTSTKDFVVNSSVSTKDIDDCFDFAWGMTFGGLGEHREKRSGGTKKRGPESIFQDTFQGKLAEYAVYNYFAQNEDITVSIPDFSQSKKGKWDSNDLMIDDDYITIKSTKQQGNLFLLEVKDWDSNATYIPNKDKDNQGVYDYFMFVRIAPAAKDIFKGIHNNSQKEYKLKAEKTIWKPNIVGFLPAYIVKEYIKQGFIIKRNDYITKRTRIDADNYYIQSGDFLDIEDFL